MQKYIVNAIMNLYVVFYGKGDKQMKKKRKKQKALSMQVVLAVLLGMVCIVCGYILQYKVFAQSSSDESVMQSDRVEISEIMSKNSGVLMDNHGRYTDWIEIVNRENTAVDLSGWKLLTADEPFKPFVFPELILQPGEYAVIFADGQEQSSTFHAPFKLSSSGEEVILLDADGICAQQITLPALENNQSYARLQSGEWECVAYCTPYLENVRENATTMQKVVADAVCINEVIPLNASLKQGGSDLIELMNTSSRSVSLAGYALSDDIADPDKYVLGNITLAPGECLLIEADGEKVPFKLSADGEQLLLSTPSGQIASMVEWDMMEADRSISRVNGEWSLRMIPTPGQPNTMLSAAIQDVQLTSANPVGLYINELMVSGLEIYDYVELYNASGSRMDLSGFGLSDDPQSPRKWQFPDGTVIKSGEYLVVYLSGYDKTDRSGILHTNFGMSCSNPETLTLCLPDGRIIDRVYMPEMYGDVSIGRKQDGGFGYLAECTPGEQNSKKIYEQRAHGPEFSVQGGIFDAGERIQLTLSAEEGMSIYYTLDSSDPTQESMLYTGPITLTDTTIVRAAAYGRNAYPSHIETQSYLFGISHTVRVVSFVSDPEGLFSDETGIMALGKNVKDVDPYTGANFWQKWERAGNVEIFAEDGTTLISQGCSAKLHGANSRMFPQKSISLTARSTYDEENRFYADLFSERDYEGYHSIVLRACGQDGARARMRDTVITQLAADVGVFYQESEICVVYINGEYWGHYDMREKCNRFAIADFEGWESSDSMSIVTGHDLATRGSDQSYADLMEWISKKDEATDEDIAYVESIVDLDNYLSWVSVMIYSGNQDIGIRRYCNTAAEDSRWKWVFFDLDFAFYNDTDSMRRWLDPAGAGSNNRADNRLFVYVMKNEKVQDRFLTIFGEMVTGSWKAENVVAAFEAQYELMLPEMPAHFERWDSITQREWQKYVDSLIEFAHTRDEKIIGYTQAHLGLTDAEMAKYFGK